MVKDYKGGEAVASGEVFDPTPENIDKRTKTIEIDGVKVAALSKKNRGSTVAMTLTLRYGNEESLGGKQATVSLLSSMLMAGTKTMDRQALQAKQDALGVRIMAGAGGGGRRGGRGGGGGGGGRGALTFSVEGKRESIVAGIELLGQILREPAFAAEEFEQLKLRIVTSMRSMQTDPSSLAASKMGQALSDYPPTDVRYVMSNDEQIASMEKATLEEVIELYKSQISAATGEVAIVGDFEVEPTLAAIAAILKDWKSQVAYRSIDREARKVMQGSKDNIITPDKANAVFLAGMAISMNEADSDNTALDLGNFILGGGTLSSRLGNRIRQKEGLSYGVSSSFSAPSKGNDARFMIQAITNPDNIDAVEKAAMEELKRFIAEGPSEQELADAKNAYLEAQESRTFVRRCDRRPTSRQSLSRSHHGLQNRRRRTRQSPQARRCPQSLREIHRSRQASHHSGRRFQIAGFRSEPLTDKKSDDIKSYPLTASKGRGFAGWRRGGFSEEFLRHIYGQSCDMSHDWS